MASTVLKTCVPETSKSIRGFTRKCQEILAWPAEYLYTCLRRDHIATDEGVFSNDLPVFAATNELTGGGSPGRTAFSKST